MVKVLEPGRNDRADLMLENDRTLESAPPQPYTRWEDYYADQAGLNSIGSPCNENLEMVADAVRAKFEDPDLSCGLFLMPESLPDAEALWSAVEELAIEFGLAITELDIVSGSEFSVRWE